MNGGAEFEKKAMIRQRTFSALPESAVNDGAPKEKPPGKEPQRPKLDQIDAPQPRTE